MGFTVTEDLSFTEYKIDVAQCYVTIKSTYQLDKSTFLTPCNTVHTSSVAYKLASVFYVYADKTSTIPFMTKPISIVSGDEITNPIQTLYGIVKADKIFAGKTLVDDL